MKTLYVKNIVVIIVLFVALSSCDITGNKLDEKDSPDSRFEGSWTSFSSGEYLEDIKEFSWCSYINKEFDDSNKYSEYIDYEKNGIQDQGYPKEFTYEWKIENGFFAQRLLDNKYSKWEYYSFKFIDNDTLVFSYYSDGYLIENEFLRK